MKTFHNSIPVSLSLLLERNNVQSDEKKYMDSSKTFPLLALTNNGNKTINDGKALNRNIADV